MALEGSKLAEISRLAGRLFASHGLGFTKLVWFNAKLQEITCETLLKFLCRFAVVGNCRVVDAAL